MALASLPEPRKRPAVGLPRRMVATAHRAEPDFAFPQATLDAWGRSAPAAFYLPDMVSDLPDRPGDPLSEGRRSTVSSGGFWKSAVGPSLLFHIAVALLFVGLATEEVQIAGGEQAQVALLGSASEDQQAAGEASEASDPEATNVTLVTMLDAKPVETTEVALVPVEDITAAEPVETMQPVAADDNAAIQPAQAEPLAPSPPETAQMEPSAQAAAVTDSQQIRPLVQAAPAATAEAETEPLTAIAASPFPQVLTAERVVPVDDGTIVPVPAETLTAPVPETIETAAAEPVVEAAGAVPAKQEQALQPVAEEPPVKTAEPPVKPVQAKARPRPEPVKPKPEKPKAAPAAKPKPAKPAAKTAEAPAKKPSAKAGSKGTNQADARRGEANGQATGKSAGKSTGGKNSAAGNAAVTNYPGKVVSKLRRALRYPAAARSQSLRGEVQVSFTVSASGGVGGIRVVRSSGSPILDKAALETVRRAAPFPPIPDGAGRSSWPFSVPLAFTR